MTPVDRTNLGNALTLNNNVPGSSLGSQIDLSGSRYSTIAAVFFIPYVLAEFPSNLALKYFSPSKWITRIMLSWEIVTMCQAAVTSYEGLIACRVFLGLAAAGFYPGVVSRAFARMNDMKFVR